MATISTGDIDLTTQFDIVECEAIEATDQSTTQSTAFRRPISVYSMAAGSVGIGNLTVPSGSSNEPDDGVNYPDGPMSWSRLIDLDKADQAIRFGGNAGGPNHPTDLTFFLHYDFMEIKEDSLLSVANVEIQVDVKNEYTTSDFGPSYNYSSWSNETHPTIRVGLMEGYPAGSVYDEVTTTSNSRQTLTATLTPTGLPNQHGFYVRIFGVQNQNGYASLKLDMYGIKARVNYTGKTNLKTGFLRNSGTINLLPSGAHPSLQDYQATTGTFDFSDRITTDTGYSVAGVGVKYGFARLTQIQVGPPKVFINTTSLELDAGDRVSIKNTNYSANVKYIDSDTQVDLSTMGEVRDTYFDTAGTTVITDDNINFYYGLDEDNTLDFTIADARDANLAVHINAHGTDQINDFSQWGETFADNVYTVSAGGDGAAEIQWAIRPPLITGDITLSSSISVADTTAKQTHGVDASELPDVSFSADTGSTLGGFKIQVESDLDTSFTQPDTDARIRVRAEVDAMSTNIDLTNTGLAGLIRTGYTIDPDFSITVADTLANNSIVPDLFLAGTPPPGFFLNQASTMRSNFSFDATGLYGVLYDMPASRVGTYEAHLDTDVTAQVFTDPAVERTFRPYYSRRFTPVTDRQELGHHPRNFQLLAETRKFTLARPLSGEPHHPRILYVGTNTRVLDMKGTGDE